jgi:hypothetical protein
MDAEQISHEAGDTDAWVCVCGNRPSADGFYPYDQLRNEIEPNVGSNWPLCLREVRSDHRSGYSTRSWPKRYAGFAVKRWEPFNVRNLERADFGLADNHCRIYSGGQPADIEMGRSSEKEEALEYASSLRSRYRNSPARLK